MIIDDDDDKSRKALLLRDEPTEATPLLGGLDGVNPGPTAGSSTPEFGSTTAVGAEEEGAVTGGDGEAAVEEVHEGIPEMAKRLYILLPAIGIGVFLCALDQLLAVATYAKIGSDLHALNSTSWIATA